MRKRWNTDHPLMKRGSVTRADDRAMTAHKDQSPRATGRDGSAIQPLQEPG
jgi:hypothetical protein